MGIKKTEHMANVVNNLEELIKFCKTILKLKLRTTGSIATHKIGFLYVKDNLELEIERINRHVITCTNWSREHLEEAIGKGIKIA